MTRFNLFHEIRSMTWGKNASALVFAALLIVCSIAVGCSSDKPKPVSSTQPAPMMQAPAPAPMPAPIVEAAKKPAPKKIVHRKPKTVNYTDKTYGVMFEYPRRYAIETGDAATQLLSSKPLPMNFVQPGGVALAAVELPETYYTNTDFSSAFFNVSVNKTLSADQCGEFAVPQPKVSTSEPSTPEGAQDGAKQDVSKSDTSATTQPVTDQTSVAKSSDDVNPNSKLLIGDMELRATEAVSGEGPRQSDSKFFHVYQNGACYEFALNVTTDASEDGLVKHVDRDRVFNRLEQILATVKINPVQPEVTAENPTPAPVPSPAPAQ